MTENKPIMIDGIDVSKCCNAEQTATTLKCTINDWTHCDGQDCYFKQLTRKTQERKELKKQLNQLKSAKEQAEQKLKQIRQMLKNGVKIHDDIIVNKSILQIIDEVE